MTDVSKTIAPKTDQLNADDLIGGKTMTIKITKVTSSGAAEQPISIYFEGDNGKPWKPCLSMRRLLVINWGDDGNKYVGRQLTLFCDPNVKFGADKVGGIRVSHMSHIDNEMTVALTASRGSRKPYTVKPLLTGKPLTPEQKKLTVEATALAKEIESADTADKIAAIDERVKVMFINLIGGGLPDWRERLYDLFTKKKALVDVIEV